MVSSVRAVLLKGLSSADPVYSSVEDTVKELKERIQRVHTLQQESACGTGISPARVKLLHYKLIVFSSSSANVHAPLRQKEDERMGEKLCVGIFLSLVIPPRLQQPYTPMCVFFFVSSSVFLSKRVCFLGINYQLKN